MENNEKAICTVCGDPMPEGEQMFKFHGYSGDCPKPPLPRLSKDQKLEKLFNDMQLDVGNSHFLSDAYLGMIKEIYK